MDLPLFGVDGSKSGSLAVDESVFGRFIHRRLLHDIVVWYEANLHRHKTANTRGRSEVSGSRRKPWKQKHTGRARIGTRMAPQWRHGGIVFGPKPRTVSVSIPKQMRRTALDSALLSKLQDGEALVWERPSLEKPKTSAVASALGRIGREGSSLIVVGKPDRLFYLSCRNLPRTEVCVADHLNPYDVLKYRNLVLGKDGLNRLLELRNAPVAPAPRKAGSKKRATS